MREERRGGFSPANISPHSERSYVRLSGFRGEATGKKNTYPAFFLAHSEVCASSRVRLSRVELSRVGPPLPGAASALLTSLLRSMPLSNTSTTKLDNFDGNRRSVSGRASWREEGGQSWPMNLPGIVSSNVSSSLREA